MSNKLRTVFYCGVTSDLSNRVEQHQEGIGTQFMQRYRYKDLVYSECFDSILEANDREKQEKNWHRGWK